MSELYKSRELLSPEQVQENLDAYLSNVAKTVANRGSENIKINHVFIAETGMHINCYFKDHRKIESLGRYPESVASIIHDKSHPLPARSLTALIGNSENYLQLIISGPRYKDERVSEIDISNPLIINNLVFSIELD